MRLLREEQVRRGVKEKGRRGNAAVNNGVAQIEISTLPVGTLSITAIYRGDTANLVRTARVLKQVVH